MLFYSADGSFPFQIRVKDIVEYRELTFVAIQRRTIQTTIHFVQYLFKNHLSTNKKLPNHAQYLTSLAEIQYSDRRKKQGLAHFMPGRGAGSGIPYT